MDSGGQLRLRPPPQAATVDLRQLPARAARVPLHGPFHSLGQIPSPIARGKQRGSRRDLRLADRPFGGGRPMAYICSARPKCGHSDGPGAGPEAENEVSGGDSAPVERGASAEPTLDELAQKLLELRQHLEQVLAGLDDASRGRVGNSSADGTSFRCHACGRTRWVDQLGWTLRLCGDDELHPLCPDCDRGHVDGYGRNGRQPEGRASSVG